MFKRLRQASSTDQVVQGPTLVLTSSKNPSVDGESVTFTASVIGGSDGNRIVFNVAGQPEFTTILSGGMATFTTELTEGSYLVSAAYYNDAAGSKILSESSLTQVMKSNLTITLTSSKNPVQYNNDVTFTAVVSGWVVTPGGVVTFNIDGRSYPVPLDNGVAMYTCKFNSIGNYKVTAAYNEISVSLMQQVKNKVKAAEITDEIEPVAQYPELKVYPNPFSENLQFEFVSPVDAQARIDIYDIAGRTVNTVFDERIYKGVTYNPVFIPDTNVSGIYFYRVIMGKSVFNGKVMYKK